MAKNIVDTLMDTVIFTALIGTIGTAVVGAAAGNVTGAAAILLLLTTLFVVIGFIRGIMSNSKSKR